MRRSKVLIIVLSLVTWATVQPGLTGNVRAANFVYLEDFSSSHYCDPMNTAALWDTIGGTVALGYHEMSIAGFYPTAGFVMTLAVEGDVAYLISDAPAANHLVAVDVSDPTTPSLLGSVEIPCWMPIMTVEGDVAYVVGYNGCFFTIDVSDPSNPAIIGEIDIYGAYPVDISVVGECAFASMDGVVVSVDISNPASPATLDYEAMVNSLGLTVHGDYMFVNCGYRGTYTLDISDPSDLAVVDTCLACLGYMGAVSGDHAVLGYGSDVYVIDISDPENLAYVSNSSSASDANYVSICGDRAYVSDEDDEGLILYDITDPTSPEKIDNIAVGGYARQSVVRGRYVYVGSTNGLYIVEVSSREDLVQMADVDLDEATRVFPCGDHAFVTGLSYGISILDISDPAAPALVGTEPVSGACDIEIRGDVAFVAKGAGGFAVYDISDPESWTVINSGPGTPPTAGLDVSGDLLFSVGGNGRWLQVLDISRLGSISTIGNYSALTGPYDVCVSGEYAYVADPYGSDLTIVDISTPNMPVYAGSYEWGQFVRSITVAGNHAYLAGDTGGLLVADVSDPANPIPVGRYDTVNRAMHVVVDGDYAYVANELSGILVLDISDPTDPVYVDSYDTPGTASGVARHGDFLLLANGDQGVFSFRALTTDFDVVGNTARSCLIDDTDEIINLVGVTMERTGDVSIEISADGGANWETVPVTYASAAQTAPLAPSWYFLANPGPDIVWRTVHHYAHDGVNPSMSSLRIDYSSEVATLLQDFSTMVVEEGVLVQWRLSQIDEGISFLVSRDCDGTAGRVTLDSSGIESEGLTFRFIDASAEPGKKYSYIIEYEDDAARHTLFETDAVEMPGLPLTLSQNIPNPFNPSTTIEYYLPERSKVTLDIYDISGRLVARLVDRIEDRGHRSVVWDGTGSRGDALASGVYFCRIYSGKECRSRKMVLLR